MKYLSKDGSQLVEAVQYTNRTSLDEIAKEMGVDVVRMNGDVRIDGQPIMQGQYAVLAGFSVVIVNSEVISRFQPVQVQDQLF